MGDELLRKWVEDWAVTGRLLESLRRKELEALTDDDVRRIVADLFSGPIALDQPPRRGSGLVEQQRLFAKMHGRG